MLITLLTLLKWFSFILIHLVNTTIILAQPDFLYHSCGDASNSYTPNSMYKQNLDTTLDGLSKTDSGLGFFNLSTGQGNDRVYSVALCRGDVHPDVCRSCLKDSVDELPSICPDQKEALGYYDRCILKYSDQTILQPTGTKFNYYSNNQKTSDDQFNEVLKALLADLTQKAAVGGPLRKYAAGNRSGPGSTIYAHVQCFPDMSEAECNDCLENLINWMSGANINRKAGGVLISTKCDFRYDTYKFFNDTTDDDIVNPPPPQQQSPPLVSQPPPLPQQKTSPPPGKKNNTTRVVTIIVVVVAVIVATIIASLCIFSRLRKKKKKPTPPPVQYDFSTMKEATNDFSEENKLGQGGFGAVYRGILRDGQEIAVKRLARDSGQGDVEFKNEVLLLAKLQHRNLVRLLGFSIEGSERLLIYEFLPNASLDHFIFDPTKRTLLHWEKRYNIIKGIANGLLYLHEESCPGIIHGDMKASNVLLDVKMNPKIADFGMVRLCKLEETQGDSSRIVRTCGYMAPEYAMKGQFSIKSDVFSFGVLVLEMVTGQKNQCSPSGDSNENLLSLAWKSWNNKTTSNMMDPILASESGSSSLRDIDNSIHIGLLCVQENNTDRPTMADVVQMLNSFPIEPRMPSEPAFFMADVVQMHISSPITPSSTPSKPTTFTRSNTDPEMPLLPETGSSDFEESKISNSGPSSSQSPVNYVQIDGIVL